jgi:hypothetical protein
MDLIFSADRIIVPDQKKMVTDSDGYYDFIVGGLNCLNSRGEYYTANGVMKLFQESSVFMRRVRSGNLKGECGHPRLEPGMNEEAWISRNLEIRENNTSHHIKDVWLELDFGRKHPEYGNPDLIAIWAKIKPTGNDLGRDLQAAIDNPHENVCFSIRTFSVPIFRGGMKIKVIDEIVTFDRVTEGGIAIATKYKTLAVESLTEIRVTLKSLQDLKADRHGVACESSQLIVDSLISVIGQHTAQASPAYLRW